MLRKENLLSKEEHAGSWALSHPAPNNHVQYLLLKHSLKCVKACPRMSSDSEKAIPLSPRSC